MNRKLVKPFLWLMVMLWIVLIFYLSHQPAKESVSLSAGFIHKIMGLILPDYQSLLPEEQTIIIDNLHNIVRKMAHLMLYFVLGVLSTLAMLQLCLKPYKLIIYSLLICIAYSISDEIHQLFVPGRLGTIRDIIIDSFGALIGIYTVKYFERRSN